MNSTDYYLISELHVGGNSFEEGHNVKVETSKGYVICGEITNIKQHSLQISLTEELEGEAEIPYESIENIEHY
jgi:hypothetical protein